MRTVVVLPQNNRSRHHYYFFLVGTKRLNSPENSIQQFLPVEIHKTQHAAACLARWAAIRWLRLKVRGGDSASVFSSKPELSSAVFPAYRQLTIAPSHWKWINIFLQSLTCIFIRKLYINHNNYNNNWIPIKYQAEICICKCMNVCIIMIIIIIIRTEVETISWWNGCQLTSRTHPLCPTKLLTILPVKTS